MTDVPRQLSEALSGRYALERELGHGGMAMVYLARDLKHHRSVALKVLRPELAQALGAERFLREIEIAAGLNHPHILPLLDSGEAGGFLYYVMPYVEGESLRDRLSRETQLPLDDAVQLAREVADALSYAHSHGVVHRDIKPENILLESGHAVVSDFGIARAIGAAGGERLTETGLAIGTPAYMSPEQATGGGLDGRSDIYSLGSVLYEMLGGEPPYTGPTPQAVIAKRLSEPVPHITTLRETVPPGLEAVITKALAKAPADRFVTASEFASALAEATLPAVPARRPRRRVWAVSALGGMLLLVALSALLLLRPTQPPSREGLPRVAVLPFELLGAPDDAHFADGLTEEITSRLAQISGLRVVSRTSALRYTDRDRDARAIGRELDVAYLLEGTVRVDRAADGPALVRVTPQLIRTGDDVHLWAERYDASLVPGELFRVQAEIAERVAAALDVTVLTREEQALTRSPTRNPDAYRDYLLGRFHLRQQTADGVRLGVQYLTQAIAADSAFAQAHAALADAYYRAVVRGGGILPNVELYSKAEGAARRALALDSTLGHAYLALAFARWAGAWDWEAADHLFRRALEFDPDLSEVHRDYAHYLRALGKLKESEEHARRAVALDPLLPDAHNSLGVLLYIERRLEEARTAYERAKELSPDWRTPRFNLVALYVDQGRLADAQREAEEAGFPSRFAELVLRALTGQTPPEVAARVLAQLEQADPLLRLRPPLMAQVYSRAGLIDSAFAKLEEGARTRDPGLLFWLPVMPVFDNLRTDPRYTALLRRIGLP